MWLRPLSVFCALVMAACGSFSAEDQELHAFENNQFHNLDGLAEFSSVIVVGEVVDVVKNREDFVEAERISSAVLTIVIEVARVLDGAADGERVSFEFQGPEVKPHTPIAEYPERLVNGVPIPKLGDEVLLFLYEIVPSESPGDAPASHGLVNFDAIYRVGDGGVLRSDVTGGGRIARTINGLTVEEVASLVTELRP